MKISLMDDTTAEVHLENKEITLEDSAKWLNKDRIWTFVFWFGMAGGFSIASFTKAIFGAPELFPVIAWTTLFSMPLIVTLANKTRFIKKDTFANSEGKLITEKQMPYSFPLAIILGFALTLVASKTILPKDHQGSFIATFVFFSFFFSGINLYFIFKNCPISILFNRKFWTFEFYPGGFRRRSYESSSSSRNNSSTDYYNNPTYSSSMSNIHYDSHRHR